MTDTSRFDELTAKLREIFQTDQADLDFGIYRIMKLRSKEIGEFLKDRLAAKVKETLARGTADEVKSIQAELEKAVSQAKSLGADPDSLPKVKDLKAKLAAFGSEAQDETEVYSHLLTFFSRYYDNGDFVSKRRYKGDVYAIPYAGEEVKLHWANADQYYVKTCENFANFDFSADGKKVHFRLVAADVRKDNVKDNEQNRGFVLWDPAVAPAETDDDEEAEEHTPLPESFMEVKEFSAQKDGETVTRRELFIYFQYVPMGGKDQPKFLTAAEQKILTGLPEEFHGLAAEIPTEKDKKRTLLRKYLTQYTARNKSDYFIHKDLKGFLTRELDFYIKNEMMHLDDIQNEGAFQLIERDLRKIRSVRAIALALIDFMAQLEEFQKKLWLKKKFVTRCEYCITLDRLPEELKKQAFENPKQIEEWKRLGLWRDDLSADKAGTEAASPAVVRAASPAGALPLFKDSLMVDTKFFDEQFKAKLLAHIGTIGNIEEQCDGVIIHSENFQALNLLQERYREQVKCIYIDPPYNTGSDGFVYKDNYQHSSWLSMMTDCLFYGKTLLSDDCGTLFLSIDEHEDVNVRYLANVVYGDQNCAGIWYWYKSATPPSLAHKIKRNIEEVLCYEKRSNSNVFRGIKKESKSNDPFTKPQNIVKRLEFPPQSISFPAGMKCLKAARLGTDRYPNILLNDIDIKDGKNVQPAIFKNRFVWTQAKLNEELKSGTVIYCSSKGVLSYKKASYAPEVPPSLIDDSVNVVTTEEAGKNLEHLFAAKLFDYPKPVSLIKYLCSFLKYNLILDYFAGSGTTGHAVMNLNREDGGNRKYILVEMSDYFDTVLKPRLEKVVYSPEWKDGKPASADKGISHCFKYLTLESYEDALNNIERKDLAEDLPGTMRDEYLLKYMLDLESRDSFISTDDFRHPFDYKLKIAVDSAGATEEQRVDLVETFNYLLGLRVSGIDRNIEKGYVFVQGTLPGETKESLIVWRDCEKVDSGELNEMLEKRGIKSGNSEFGTIFVNGDHGIRNRKIGDAEDLADFKVKQIENEFLTRMFEVK